MIEQSGEHLLRLITELLDTARIEAGERRASRYIGSIPTYRERQGEKHKNLGSETAPAQQENP